MNDAEGMDIVGVLAWSARWRLVSLLFSWPREGMADEVRALGESLDEPWRSSALEVADLLSRTPDLGSSYHRLLGPGGACPPAESDHDPAASCNKGPLIADVCAFYRAFGYDPGAESCEAPDHVAVECAFYSYLHLKYAYARFSDQPEAAEVTKKAIADFWSDHLSRFLPSLLTRLQAVSSGHPYFGCAVRACMMLAGLEERGV